MSAGRLALVVIGLVVSLAGAARAAGLDPKELDELRQARQLYKSGNYQGAADIFSRLSAAHPDMPQFTRNAGAAYYYLKKPDPALSNLREYLRVQKKLTPEDREEVDKWIAEMEKLRAQGGVPAAGAAPATFPNSQPAPVGASPVPAAPGYPPAPYYAPYVGPPGYAPGMVPGPMPGTSPVPAPVFPGPAPAAPLGASPAGSAPGYPGALPAGSAPAYPEAAPPQPPAPEQAVPPVVEAGTVEQSLAPREAGALPWVIGGAGVAAIALGGVFTYMYRSAYADTRAQYDPGRESAGRTYSYLQFVCYGLGAAGVATGAILLFRSDQGTQVSVVPALGPRLAGAEVQVRY